MHQREDTALVFEVLSSAEDNKFIISVANDGSVRCWHTISGKPTCEPCGVYWKGMKQLKSTQIY